MSLLDLSAEIPERGRGKYIWREINRINRALRMLQPVASLNLGTGVTGIGTWREAREDERKGSPGLLIRYRIKEVLGEHLRCRKWDGSTEAQSDVAVAKPFHLRVSSFNGLLLSRYGKSWAFGGDSFSRTGSQGAAPAITEHLTPAYGVDQEILAAKVDSKTGTGLAGIDWEDVNVDARQWLLDLVEIGVCVPGATPGTTVTKKILIAGSSIYT